MTKAMVCKNSVLERKTWHMQSSFYNYPRNFFQKWYLETVSSLEGDISPYLVRPPVPYTAMDWLSAQPDKWSVRLASHGPFSSPRRLGEWIKHIPLMPLPHSTMALLSQKSLRQKALYKLGGLLSVIHSSVHAIHSNCTSLSLRAWVFFLSCPSYFQTCLLVGKWNGISRCRYNPFSLTLSQRVAEHGGTESRVTG